MKQSIYPSLPVLLVDDEAQFLMSANFTLSSAGINNIVECRDSRKVIPMLEKQEFEVILLDILMPHMSGNELLQVIGQEYPHIPVIMMTAVNEVETAVECMKKGTFDYLVKPVDEERLVTSIKHAIGIRELRNENIILKEYLLSGKLEHPEAFCEIITRSSTMRSIFQYAEAIAVTSLPVLITGETGTGKELMARAIHKLSGRRGELITVNVAGLDDNLFSDTLFGHTRGAFTSADKQRKGLIEQAAEGTLFLDEIGDISMESQVKLLRLLEEGKYYPLGSDMPHLTDARIVVATNRDIESEKERFRKDLYYRLQAHHIIIPPLRKRRKDIPLLVECFLTKAAEELGKNKPTPPRELITLLSAHHFPGNIRELKGMIFDAVSKHKSGVLSMETFKEKIAGHKKEHGGEPVEIHTDENSLMFADKLPTLKEAEHLLIDEAMKRADGNQTIAAGMIGLTRRALNNRLQRAGRQK